MMCGDFLVTLPLDFENAIELLIIRFFFNYYESHQTSQYLAVTEVILKKQRVKELY